MFFFKSFLPFLLFRFLNVKVCDHKTFIDGNTKREKNVPQLNFNSILKCIASCINVPNFKWFLFNDLFYLPILEKKISDECNSVFIFPNTSIKN